MADRVKFHRKKFERWFINDTKVEQRLRRDDDGQYLSLLARWAWQGWCAALITAHNEAERPLNYRSMVGSIPVPSQLEKKEKQK